MAAKIRIFISPTKLSHVAKIWKKISFLKEFFNEILDKVEEHE